MTKWWDEEHEAMVVLISFPDGVDEAVCPNEDGSHTIFLSDRLSDDARICAYIHALGHISRDDFYAEANVQALEAYAHGGVA